MYQPPSPLRLYRHSGLIAALPLGHATILGKWPMEELKVPVNDLPQPIFQRNILCGIDVHENYKPPFKERAPNKHV
jgi:hypothetical protein